MILSQAGKERGAFPAMISVDNPHIEAFNSVVRRECPSQHWVIDFKDAQEVLDRWRLDYNTVRPHGSLQRSTPAQYGAGVPFTPSPERLRNLHP